MLLYDMFMFDPRSLMFRVGHIMTAALTIAWMPDLAIKIVYVSKSVLAPPRFAKDLYVSVCSDVGV